MSLDDVIMKSSSTSRPNRHFTHSRVQKSTSRSNLRSNSRSDFRSNSKPTTSGTRRQIDGRGANIRISVETNRIGSSRPSIQSAIIVSNLHHDVSEDDLHVS